MSGVTRQSSCQNALNNFVFISKFGSPITCAKVV
jgi:hypothetical protein